MRVTYLRGGYIGFGLAILLLAGSFVPGLDVLVLGSPLLAIIGAILFVLSKDAVAKWAGWVFLGYGATLLIAFVGSEPITIRSRLWRGSANPDPPAFMGALRDVLILALPFVLTASAVVAAWEREHGARLLLIGALVGLVGVGILTVALDAGDASSQPAGDNSSSEAILKAQARANSQGGLLKILLALSTVAGASGAAWAAWRPDA